uniref:Odorant receptor n=1 Tax=Phlebotomus papatasi TaxID=29031 RepID=A0A3F2ZEN2_PHLPP
MVDYVECYPEYLELEDQMRYLITILKFSFLKINFLHGFEEYILPILQIYALISTVFSMVIYDRNVTLFGINSLTICAILQLLSKMYSTVFKTNDINELFLFIQQVHQVHKIEFKTHFIATDLEKILRIIKLVLRKFLIPVWGISGFAFNLYCMYYDIILFSIPGIVPQDTQRSVYQHIHQFVVMLQLHINLVVVDVILITFGLYFVAITNIFDHMIRNLDNLDPSNITSYLVYIYEFHCKLLKRYEILNEVFGYVFTIQTATSVVFILFMIFLLRGDEFMVFVPLSMAIFTQFGIFCIFGEFLFSKTEGIATEIYQSKWYEFSIKEQKMLLMMMYMAKRPFALKAAGMYNVNLLMFIQVFKAGFSFCALLYTFA